MRKYNKDEYDDPKMPVRVEKLTYTSERMKKGAKDKLREMLTKDQWSEIYYEDEKLNILKGQNIIIPIFGPAYFDLTTSKENEKPHCGKNNSWNPTTGYVSRISIPSDTIRFYIKEGKYYRKITNSIDFIKKN